MSRKVPTGWEFSQTFGGDGAQSAKSNKTTDNADADLLTTVEFDPSGNYLAAGDKGGCICIFKTSTKVPEPVAATSRRPSFWKKSPKVKVKKKDTYDFHVDFQSHEAEFDYLKSLEIEEKINKIKWCRKSSNSLMLLSTNDKTIKLWKVSERQLKTVSHMNMNSTHSPSFTKTSALQIPKLTRNGAVLAATPRRKYSNAHAYHINSISVCSDGETFISADDLRVNMWNLSRCDRSFTIVDIKPENMEELTEVITSAVFHPHNCNQFMFSSSCGKIMLGDLRAAAICDSHMKCMYEPDDSSNNSFFSEIIASISDVKFSGCGKYAISRNYLGIKVWDLAMENKPVATISINNHLKPKLCDLYENDCIFDKFELAVNGDGSKICTGAYHNFFHVYGRNGKLEADMRAVKPTISPSVKRKVALGFGSKKKKAAKENESPRNPEDIDFNQKILHVTWHPTENKVAMAAKNLLYIYDKPGKV